MATARRPPGSPDHFSHRPDSPAPNNFFCSCLPAANHPSALDHFFSIHPRSGAASSFCCYSLFTLSAAQTSTQQPSLRRREFRREEHQQEAAACVKVLQGEEPHGSPPILICYLFSLGALILRPVPSQGKSSQGPGVGLCLLT
jgi:hypothetical protein